MEETSVVAEFVLMGPMQLVDIEVFPHIFYSYRQCLMTVIHTHTHTHTHIHEKL